MTSFTDVCIIFFFDEEEYIKAIITNTVYDPGFVLSTEEAACFKLKIL